MRRTVVEFSLSKIPTAAWVAAFVALTLAFTWPLGNFADPLLPRHDDPLFSTWRLAWVAHQLPRDPWHLFDTNIFYPANNTLSYSDAMLLLGLAGAPFIWLGVPPVIVHNVLVIVAFVTAGVAMMRLAAYFTPNRAAQVMAGLIFAFAPYRIAHIVHLELLWTAFLPLALLALYRLLERPSLRRAVWFGATVGLQFLCSVYYGVFLVVWLIPALLLAPLHVPIQWSRRHLAAFAASVVTAAVLVSPYVGPYSAARQALGPRSDHDIEIFSAQLSDYLQPSPYNRLYGSPLRLEQDERSLYFGGIAMALCAVAIVFVRERKTVVCGALTLAAIDLSLGVNGILFPAFKMVLPFLDGFRAPARFGALALLGASLVAALGVTRLLAWSSSRSRTAIAMALAVTIVAEYWAAPIDTYQVPLTPGEAHSYLAAQPPTVVAALPMPLADQLWGYETVFQYLSIFHWQRMVNGYSGYAPPAYLDLLGKVHDFPSDRAVKALRRHGVQTLLLHERYGPAGQFDKYLYACHNRAWFDSVQVFAERSRGRSAVCRLAAVE